jgi:hypothetical protein
MADALASGASVRKDVGVQVPPRAPGVSTKKARGHPPFESCTVFTLRM